jgi:exopolyphosphatase/guanosine-5'-triphosphate,3'-diphosphate pyrophosphatase
LAPYTALISPQWAEDAQILGRALRFGAMFLLRSDSSGMPAQLEWSAQNMTLTLHLDAAAQPLYGEIAEKRFEALAKSLQAQAVVQAP